MCVWKAIPYHDASEIIPHYNLPLTKSALALTIVVLLDTNWGGHAHFL